MKIEKTECNYQVTECDLKFGEQITLDGELLIPASVLDKIRAEIAEIHLIGYATVDGKREIASRAVMQILDKHKAESEE